MFGVCAVGVTPFEQIGSGGFELPTRDTCNAPALTIHEQLSSS